LIKNHKAVKYGLVSMEKVTEIIEIAYEAGEGILEIYKTMNSVEVEYKEDKSPLTEADKKAHSIIENRLKKVFDYPILSEEGKEVPYEKRRRWKYFWLVDPLDGTKEFIKRNGEFTVNIALIHNQKPVLGVVYAPALNLLYYGEVGKGGYKIENGKKEKLSINYEKEKNKITVVASKSHLNEETSDFIEGLKNYYSNVETVSIGSSLKICLLAEGKADIYPRIAPTMEWDTAAAHAVLNSAGGKIVQYKNVPFSEIRRLPELLYNKENLLNPYFVAFRKDAFRT